MPVRPSPSLLAAAAAAALAGCAAPRIAPPDVPAALRVPAGQAVYIEALAKGTQIYECAQKADGTYEWAFKAPEAVLSDRSGTALGKHYAGPTWESVDGSSVVGEVKGRDAGPDASAIPWLLLAAKSNSGNGVFAAAKSVQRISTVGGVAPAETCSGANLKQVVKVPYTATYYFYRTAT